MNKRTVVRLELIVLAVIVVLLLYRVTTSGEQAEGLVSFEEVDVAELHHEAFRSTKPVTVYLEATGSFASADAPELAAYAWILRRNDRRVVWSMTEATPARHRGTLAEAADSLVLEPGTYDVFFTSYGNENVSHARGSFWSLFTGGRRAWRNDQNEWQLSLRLSPDAPHDAVEYVGDDERELAPAGPGLLWTSAPAEGHGSQEFMFRVERPVRLGVYALGEIDATEPMDYGWIENVVTGERVWELRLDNTEPAGGWAVNRRFEGELTLIPGLYRAAYRTDARQSFDDWVGNPPFDPAGWGLTLFVRGERGRSSVAAFDPWKDTEPLLAMVGIRNDEERVARFVVAEPAAFVVYAQGEIGSSAYDYGWIENDTTGEVVWQMSRERSREAGGDDNNRVETAFLRLEPGSYTAHYRTDDSHAFGDWSNGTPEHPERWGLTLFPYDATSRGAVTIVEEAAAHPEGAHAAVHASPDLPPEPPVPPVPMLGTGREVIRATGLGGNEKRDLSFQLEEPARLHVVALGEISLSGRYDYGWIDDATTGRTVWEMTWGNTEAAGGDDRNRRFDGIIELPRGRYVAHFRTDFSHHFGDFGDRAPVNPEAWGITIEKLDVER